jgi:glycosyltransferase involved in cell wall biosynthesis
MTIARVGGTLRAAVRITVAVPALPLLLVAAVASRRAGARRRASGALPRLVWGPVPVIAIKYWSHSLRSLGYESHTCVFGHYAINERSDFDIHYDEFLPRGVLFDPLRAYAVFLWVLRSAEVYLSYFDGGFLRGTAIRRLELPLLRLAGKRLIVSPYGSDIAVPGHLGVAEQRLLEDYPSIARDGERVRRRVLEFARWADLVIRNYQYGFMPRWDVLWPTQIAIDTDRWLTASAPGHGDGRGGEVVIVHAPNHRRIKGSDRLIEVVERLAREGLQVRLELLEQRPNEEVRETIMRADIVADQFIAGYALFAIEGMAASRPVLSALTWMPADVRADLDARGLPIVDADLDTLERQLRRLVTDPSLRETLGTAGRRFVLEHHSYPAVGAIWDSLIRHVWAADPLTGLSGPSSTVPTG